LLGAASSSVVRPGCPTKDLPKRVLKKFVAARKDAWEVKVKELCIVFDMNYNRASFYSTGNLCLALLPNGRNKYDLRPLTGIPDQ
jgi:hypothetical protein